MHWLGTAIRHVYDRKSAMTKDDADSGSVSVTTKPVDGGVVTRITAGAGALKAAADAAGVLAVLTGEDYKKDGLGEIHCHFPVPLLSGPPVSSPYPALAQGVVKTVGEAVVFIVAYRSKA